MKKLKQIKFNSESFTFPSIMYLKKPED